MRQKAIVVETRGAVATVEVLRATMCEGCEKSKNGGSCSCGELLGANRTMRAQAQNVLGAKIGDSVEVETESRTVLGYAALVFLLPVVLALVFYLAGGRLFGAEKWAWLSAAVGFVLAFVPIFVLDRMQKGKPQMAVVSVLRSNETESTDLSEE